MDIIDLVRPAHSDRSRPSTAALRIGTVSTQPPTLCGLATFSAALRAAWEADGHRVDVVRVVDAGDDHGPLRGIATTLVPGSPESTARAVRILDAADAAVIQHEFGIFGGADGDEVLDLVRPLSVPVTVVLHTVPQSPSPRQSAILVELAALSRWTVVMSQAARDRLLELYPQIDARTVVTIPHGAALPPWPAESDVARSGLLTWGLIGPGKGIEHVVDAVGLLRQDGVDIAYTVAGVTHPKVRARDGERYRDGLRERADALGVGDLVRFDSTYRRPAEMAHFVADAGIVVLPYDSREQVTSGVLVDSIAAGRPVIATRFPHAVEMLASGAGVVVPHGEPRALAAAVRRLVTDDTALADATQAARMIAPSLSWPTVARHYVDLHASGTRRSAYPRTA